MQALKQKMSKIEELMRRQGMGYSFDFDDMLCIEGDKLPDKFKMPHLQKFNGSGDLRIHLSQYTITMSTIKISLAVVTKLFVLSLEGIAINWSAEGTFQTLMKMGLIELMVEFIVLDIPITYALLLGRPWFHLLGGVPSTVYQKIKFPYEGEVVTIDASMSKAVTTILDSQKQVIAPSDFQVAGILDGNKMDLKVIKIMELMQYQPRLRLGKN